MRPAHDAERSRRGRRAPAREQRRGAAVQTGSRSADGDTFVVDVTSFNDKTWLSGVGTVHTEGLRVTERYTRDSYDTIRYEATMEDPAVLTRPFTICETFRLRPGERIREYECIESNEDLQRFQDLLQSGAIESTE